jgi:hypothetical protein
VLLTNTINIVVELFISGTMHILARHFLVNQVKERKMPWL